MTDEEIAKRIQNFASEMCEHVEAIQILVSNTEDGVCKSFYRGCGNWYARQGMAHEFINKDVAQENAQQLSEKINPPENGEEWKA